MMPAAGQKPTVFLIGDSTVKNGQDNGANGQWGWGHILPYYFDKEKVNVENDALGGTSSRTFLENQNLWPRVLPKVQAGDFVLMQFGHNDNTAPPESDTLRYRSTIKGVGEETVEGPKQGGGNETIHTFGWYMRKFVTDTRAKGATPIICSLIPRNNWPGGKVNRATTSYGGWAKEVATQTGALFIPLNDLIADKYDAMGQEKVTAELFPPRETTHPNWAGAKLNAECVVEGIKELKDCPLKEYLLAEPKVPAEPDVAAHGGRGRGRQVPRREEGAEVNKRWDGGSAAWWSGQCGGRAGGTSYSGSTDRIAGVCGSWSGRDSL